MAWRRRWVAAVVLVLVASGCADDTPEPKFEPGAGSPTRPATSAPGPVTKPWEKKTRAGAVAFAKHWVEVFSEAMQTGNTAELRMLSAKDCETCANVIVRVHELHDDGGSYSSDGWRVLQAASANQRGGRHTFVALQILRTAESYRESAGAPKRFNKASRASYSARLEWSGKAWIMLRLDAVA